MLTIAAGVFIGGVALFICAVIIHLLFDRSL
jgi:hypothetical protein